MTGEQHTRYLIATRMMSAYHSRYHKPLVLNHFYHSTYFIMETDVLSESLVSEWTDIVGKYKKRNFKIQIENGQFKIEVN
jgi:hypothetical protein